MRVIMVLKELREVRVGLAGKGGGNRDKEIMKRLWWWLRRAA